MRRPVVRFPRVQLDTEERRKLLKDPHILTLEVLFAALSVGNVLILYYLMSVVIPFPITVTWFQLLYGLLYAKVLGECGKEFPNLAYFVPVKFDVQQMIDLAVPTASFLAMIVMGNILLAKLPSVAMFPVAASFAICSHHFTRFIGCGQIYRPVRWASLGLMLTGFIAASFDTFSLGYPVLSTAILYGLAAATYRGCFLERAMHVVQGMGNNLHNAQSLAGIIILPFFIACTRERRFFTFMPDNFTKGYTWLLWGCLVTAAVLPFVKNIIANRLIKLAGQPPWRIIELGSMLGIFFFGWIIFDRMSLLSILGFILVFAGRSLNSMDAISVEEQAQAKGLGKKQPQNAGMHGASGAAEPFLGGGDFNRAEDGGTSHGRLRHDVLYGDRLRMTGDSAKLAGAEPLPTSGQHTSTQSQGPSQVRTSPSATPQPSAPGAGDNLGEAPSGFRGAPPSGKISSPSAAPSGPQGLQVPVPRNGGIISGTSSPAFGGIIAGGQAASPSGGLQGPHSPLTPFGGQQPEGAEGLEIPSGGRHTGEPVVSPSGRSGLSPGFGKSPGAGLSPSAGGSPATGLPSGVGGSPGATISPGGNASPAGGAAGVGGMSPAARGSPNVTSIQEGLLKQPIGEVATVSPSIPSGGISHTLSPGIGTVDV